MTEHIKDRIEKVIEAENLTNTKFAELIGVPKSSISHIINGRNKPSLDLVTRTLVTFSTLNSEWLLFGRGQMYKNDRPENNTLFSNETIEKKEEDNISETEPTEESSLNETKNIQTKSVDESPNISETKENTENKSLENEDTPPKDKTTNSPKSETDRIIIFSSDRTFIEYTPKK
ncbi:MAG: helix-turn-helix transcriptional regulator [Bacteroidota bacterium]|nr:helix-turn-helix transcriptional regulator [Bacteroidota bacterium]